jgi:hypothetical protein
MTDAEKIAALEAQVKQLTERMDDLFRGFKKNSWNMANHVRRLDAAILDVREGLNTAYHKLFPGARADYKKIEEFMGPVITKKRR